MTVAGPADVSAEHHVGRPAGTGLRLLAVDDEAPSLADLVYELRAIEGVASVVAANDATEALREVRTGSFDAVFLDVRMPGLNGLELARVLTQFRSPPPIVFVTAFDDHVVEAFDIPASDYLLKPVRRERLEQAIARIVGRATSANVADLAGLPMNDRPSGGGSPPTSADPVAAALTAVAAAAVAAVVVADAPRSHPFDEDLISIESGGRMRVIDRRDVHYVAASGDYVRLHLATSSVLIRVAMSTLEEHWSNAGFVRIHRSHLVSLAHVTEILVEHGHGYRVRIGDQVLPVSRRLAGNLRVRLLEYAARRARP